MDFLELLRKKRNGGCFTRDEIFWFVEAFTQGRVPDYQMAALLMAIYFRGMSKRETVFLTQAMMNSGKVLDLSGIPGVKIDKHSTGGVGDKVSLILAPLAAACGIVVPMISGRSLGHTGGTLDKLESIPGLRTDLKCTEFLRVLEKVGVAMVGQTEEMCPADRRLYALRDVTATVESLPLIASSIMSKKLAAGIDGLVLDVKVGKGAFMKRRRDARKLAQLLIEVGRSMGKPVVALITDMEQPLGRAVGNALEVREAIAALKNQWAPDLKEVTLALVEEMLLLSGRVKSRPQARRQILRALETGRALEKFRQMIAAQGGDPNVVDNDTLLPAARCNQKVVAERAGYIRGIDAFGVGMLGLELGLGRRKLDDEIDHGAGFVFHRKVGERVEKGEILAEVFAREPVWAEMVAGRLADCFTYSDRPVRRGKTILDRIVS